MSETTAALPPKFSWRSEAHALLLMALGVLALHSFIGKPFYIPSESMMPGLQVGDHLIVSKYPYGWSYVSPSLALLPFVPGRLLGRLPARGDVVILTPPGAARRREDMIKRVVGLPGDTIQMIGGRLWRNGQPVPQRDLGARLIPVDGNFRCDPADPDPGRAYGGFATARVTGADGRRWCRVHVLQETLPDGRTYETLDFGRSDLDDFPAYSVPPGRVFVMGDNRDNSADSRVPLALGGLDGAVPIENIGGRAEFVVFSLNGSLRWDPRSWPGAFRDHRWARTLRPQPAE